MPEASPPRRAAMERSVGFPSTAAALDAAVALTRLAQEAGSPSRPTRAGLAAKRLTDVVIGALLLVLALPVFLLVFLLTLVDGGWPVLFRQRRIGRDGRQFDIWKFRTLPPAAERRADQAIAALARGEMSVAEAVTDVKARAFPEASRIGRWVRRTSLDELPQLWHVIKGDMSLVGPRPLRPFEVEALEHWQYERQELRPGLTGLWQVLGRSDIDWDLRMALDCIYVRDWSLGLDLRILLRTPGAVLRGRGAL